MTTFQCLYFNDTDQVQIIRVEDSEQWVEKTLPPGAIYQFCAHQDSYLSIYTYESPTMVLSDRIPCRQLEIKMPNSHSSMEHLKSSIIQERLRLARQSSNLAIGAIVVSFCIGLVGATLIFFYGRVSEGSITSAGSFISSAQCLKFAKESNDRLDKILAELED